MVYSPAPPPTVQLKRTVTASLRASASVVALFIVAPPMSGRVDALRVEVLEDEIIVILPATSYGVVYHKPANAPQLLVKNFLSKNDSGAPMTQAEFFSRAWQAANDKARELGWIV
jgi:predicted alpha/beta hydrolase family esterase